MSVRFSNCPLYSGLASRKWHLKVKVTVSSHQGAVFNYSPIRADSQYGSKASPEAQLTLSTPSETPASPAHFTEALKATCTPREAWPGILTQTGHRPNYKCLDGHFVFDLSPRLEMDIGNWARCSKIQHLKTRREEKKKFRISKSRERVSGVWSYSASIWLSDVENIYFFVVWT